MCYSNVSSSLPGLIESIHTPSFFRRFFSAPTTPTPSSLPIMLISLLIAAIVLYVSNVRLSRRFLNNATPATFDWDTEIVVVTGGAGGIGGKTVLELAKNRATRIVVLDVMALTYKKPDNVFYFRCDLSNYNMLQDVAANIRATIGNPTIIVANAGICRGKSLLAADTRDIEMTFGINTLGLIWTIKTFLPHLVNTNHGHLLLMSSQTNCHTTVNGTDYSASKAAVLSIYEGIQTELRHVYNAPAVRVSVLKPSHVRTKMFRGIRSVPGMASMTPEDVAVRVVQVLYSGYGQNIFVPGYLGLSPWIRVLPDWCRVALQDMTASAFMDLDPHDPMRNI